ncbi:MAG TPA: hypothetical protein PLB25_16775 [Rhodoferax sp.]|nr:hypothetical protein [Rhodoferax sp.]
MAAKEADDRAKQLEKWQAQVAAKKLTKAECTERLRQHAELWFGRTENDIARKIERAHLYSFNLPNYRSSLSLAQIEAWESFAATRVREGKAATTLEAKYRAVAAAGTDELDEMLSSLDPRHTMELDWARQFLAGVPNEEFGRHPHLNTLQEVIASQAKGARVQLKELIKPREEKIKKSAYDGVLPIVEKISFSDGRLHFREDRETGMDLYKACKGDLVTSKINLHQGAVALAPSDLVTSTHYLPYEINVGEVNPEYLVVMIRSAQFRSLIDAQKNSGIKNEQGAEFLGEFEIPIPDRKVQEELVAELKRCNKITDSSLTIVENWEAYIPPTDDRRVIGEFVIESLYGIADKLTDHGDYPVLRMNNLDERGFWHLDDLKFIDRKPSEERLLKHGDFIFNRTNSIALVGKSAVVDFDFPGTWAGYLVRLRFSDGLNPSYLRDVLSTRPFRQIFAAIARPAGGQANLNVEEFSDISIPYFSPEKQVEIVAANQRDRLAIQQLDRIGQVARRTSFQLLKKHWES